jgi:hypothetical protein
MTSLSSIDASLSFLFESLYFFLILYLRNAQVYSALSTHLPTHATLLSWLDTLTELTFLLQATTTTTTASDPRTTRALAKL